MNVVHARRSRAAEGEESINEVNATKIINFINKRRLVLSSFKYRYNRYKWYIGTYHVYKRLKPQQLKKLSKLSFLSDKLRKYYPKGTVIYITKELSEDRFPHYHFLVGLLKDDWGCVVSLKQVPNLKMWSREWSLKYAIHYHDDSDDHNRPFFIIIGAESKGFPKLDVGAKQRWFKYGIYQYLLYMFKYSDFIKYEQYFIQN